MSDKRRSPTWDLMKQPQGGRKGGHHTGKSDLGMDDYRNLGVMAAINVVSRKHHNLEIDIIQLQFDSSTKKQSQTI